MRYPAVAGAFYERSRDALLRQIRECYTHPLGPGRVPQVQSGDRRILGLVVPHAGYVYLGPIASSDFTHVGPQYNQIPTRGLSAPEFAKEQDAKAIEKILALDANGFAGKVTQAEISMCGYGPVIAMLTAAKQLGGKGAKLLKYGTSSDVSHDAHMAVGYGAIAGYR